MKRKDRVIVATDHIAAVMPILIRINYDNDAQARSNLKHAIDSLKAAIIMLAEEEPK